VFLTPSLICLLAMCNIERNMSKTIIDTSAAVARFATLFVAFASFGVVV